MKYITILILALFLSSCSDDKSDDAEIYVGEQDAAIVGEQQAAKSSAAVRGATYRYYNVGDQGKYAWRIPRKGPSFGSRLLITFSNGFRVVIPNSSKRCSLRNGFIYRPGIGSIKSGTGTSHGGIYIYAPRGNKSQTLTISRI